MSPPAPTRGTHPAVLQAVHVLLVLAAVAYAGVTWELAAGFPLDPVRSYLSENAARGQPLRALFVATDTLAGGLAALAGAALLRVRRAVPPTARRWVAVVSVALVVTGAATVVDAFNPMACAPSADSRCAAAEAARTLGVQHTVHEVASSVVSLAVVTTCVGALALARRTAGRGRTRAAWCALAPAATLVTSAVVGAIAVASTLGAATPPVGLWQRAQTLGVCATFVVLVPLLRAVRDAARREEP
ncbi:DUF998 domain-containing protein [Cellulomonas sp. B6]|jgi:hypothetical protein|uniref:DUF998 domain-containing protein n=1 Tax=Cellulomonas sp. B6 TaxID=1295626 RepID=UPI00073B7EDD|nr:DUF998 domain-containing protein [Cellulomonas sp. B6]KSW17190.1 hypothetical protein ATM99_18165 [Cellulomonas sp. B6]